MNTNSIEKDHVENIRPTETTYQARDTGTTSKRMLLWLHILTGGTLALTAILADYILGRLSHPLGPFRIITLTAGLAIIAAGFFQHVNSVSRVSAILCLPLISVFALLGLGEGFFRMIAFDFASEAKVWREFPPFFRQPIVPTGKVFFKHPGPERWTGQVLNTYVKRLGPVPNPYTDEPVITVEYNRQGFRNPDSMTSWEIAVAGDSFTELGYLPYDQLFTTVLGRALNISVLNLGTSYTGPLTQLSYLQDYGVSPSTKHTVIMFYEGNDLDDLPGEYQALVRWRASGERDYREFKKQPSLVRFLFAAVNRFAEKLSPPRERNIITAYFKSPAGDIPITLAPSDAPPGRSNLSKETLQQLRYFFREYSAFGKDRHVVVLLAYVPTKLRVLHGRLEFSASTLAKFPKLKKLQNWQPSDLPEVISELCDQYGVRFIDLTPALIEETVTSGQLLYNSLHDTHLNRHGSLVVGQELARHFSPLNLRSADTKQQN